MKKYSKGWWRLYVVAFVPWMLGFAYLNNAAYDRIKKDWEWQRGIQEVEDRLDRNAWCPSNPDCPELMAYKREENKTDLEIIKTDLRHQWSLRSIYQFLIIIGLMPAIIWLLAAIVRWVAGGFRQTS